MTGRLTSVIAQFMRQCVGPARIDVRALCRTKFLTARYVVADFRVDSRKPCVIEGQR